MGESKKVEAKTKKPPRKIRKIDKTNVPPPPPKTTDLTGKVMKEMSLFYGLAIQRNPESVDDMKKEIWSCFYHKISTDDAPQHQYCNAEWCKYLQAEADKEPFTHKPALSTEVQEYVKPVYEKLTDENLLKRCLGKNTQNNNECYNKTLWAIVPKHTFAGKNVVDLAVHISLSIFNEGRESVVKMMEVMGCKIGRSAYDYGQIQDEIRISKANQASSASSKEARISKKQAQQEEEQDYVDSGVLLYGPGIAD